MIKLSEYNVINQDLNGLDLAVIDDGIQIICAATRSSTFSGIVTFRTIFLKAFFRSFLARMYNQECSPSALAQNHSYLFKHKDLKYFSNISVNYYNLEVSKMLFDRFLHSCFNQVKILKIPHQ